VTRAPEDPGSREHGAVPTGTPQASVPRGEGGDGTGVRAMVAQVLAEQLAERAREGLRLYQGRWKRLEKIEALSRRAERRAVLSQLRDLALAVALLAAGALLAVGVLLTLVF